MAPEEAATNDANISTPAADEDIEEATTSTKNPMLGHEESITSQRR